MTSPAVVACIPNLFDRPRFGSDVAFVDSGAEARPLHPRLVLVDLDRCEDGASFRLDGATVIGFGPHVDSDLQRQAFDWGYDEVLTRSVFFKRLPSLLASEG